MKIPNEVEWSNKPSPRGTRTDTNFGESCAMPSWKRVLEAALNEIEKATTLILIIAANNSSFNIAVAKYVYINV